MRSVSERGWGEEWIRVWRCGACVEHWTGWTTCLSSSLNGVDGWCAGLPLIRLLDTALHNKDCKAVVLAVLFIWFGTKKGERSSGRSAR